MGEKNKKITDRLKKETIISEAYFTALFYNNPSLYAFYPEDKVNVKTFQNPAWGFYFGLGRSLFKKEIKIFDDISVMNHVKELGLQQKYENYGEFNSIEEVMHEVKGKEDNIDAYYDEIKKYALLRNLITLFGDKVLEPNGKYNYKTMNKNQIHIYWNDQVNQLGMDGDNKYDEHDLLKGLREDIIRWNENPAVGLPFYKSPQMTKMTTGWDYGHVYIFAGFGGSGKTSMSFNKVVMSCISEREKLLIIANEQGIDEFKKMLIITAMGVGTKNTINRQKFNEGGFTKEEFQKMLDAVDWVEELCGGDEGLIKFVFMEDYIMSDVKKLIKHYANRGYKSIIVDTAKPSEGDTVAMARWERFTEDFKELYKLARPNGGGLNLRCWCNVQLADTSLKSRYLDEHALGDSKKIKNEASVVFLIRGVWADEYEDGSNELEVYKWEYDPNNPFSNEHGYYKKEFKLEKGKVFYLLFCSKNRRGRDNKTGLDILVLQPNFNNNTWYEVGQTYVPNDKNY